MFRKNNSNISIFDKDAIDNAGYIYTTNTQLSSQLATQRSTDIILEVGLFKSRSVLDMACGDGSYTIRYWDHGRPRVMVGIDAAENAIKIANINKQKRPIKFVVGDIHRLPFPDDSFDIALVQSVLHHDHNPLDVVREAFRIAPEILIHEPNGNNLGLKVIEKTSSYHRAHNEISYSSRKLRYWVEKGGGHVVFQRFAGFVPMFCPDLVAKTMKAIEPLIEQLPCLNALGCAVYVIRAVRL